MPNAPPGLRFCEGALNMLSLAGWEPLATVDSVGAPDAEADLSADGDGGSAPAWCIRRRG